MIHSLGLLISLLRVSFVAAKELPARFTNINRGEKAEAFLHLREDGMVEEHGVFETMAWGEAHLKKVLEVVNSILENLRN